MTTELGIHVYGEPGEIDAGQVLAGLRHVLDLLKNIEDSRTQGRGGRSSWKFTSLDLNSVETGFAVLHPRPGTDDDEIDTIVQLAVDGLALTEANPELPGQWPQAAIDSARKLANTLGDITDRGVRMTVNRDNRPVATAEVTVRCARNIDTATSQRKRSFGSVIGTLDTVNVHDRREAGLWTELRQQRVAVRFGPEMLDQVRAAIGKRVEVTGVLWRDYRGHPMSVELRRLTELRTRAESPQLTELAGAWVRDTP